MSCPALTPGATPATLIVSGPWTAGAVGLHSNGLWPASPSIDGAAKKAS